MEVLTKSLDFQKILKKGKRIYPSHWMVFSALKSENQKTRVGWTVPRTVGSAVIRNKLKRWCRTFFRNQKHLDEISVDINVYFRQKKDKNFYKNLKHSEFDEKLSKAIQLLQKQ